MGHGWLDCSDEIREWIRICCDRLDAELGMNRVGTYLHGSLASGSFHPPKSDVDVLFVVEVPLSHSSREAFAVAGVEVGRDRPIVGGLECSVILARHARRPVHPMPVEVHVSEEWVAQILGGEVDHAANRTDPDLVGHCQAVREVGVRLSGAPVREVFAEVPREYFLASIRGDLEWILEGRNIVESPFYGVLNLCRGLWVVEGHSKRLAPSKEQAGTWARTRVPSEHLPLLDLALEVYRDDRPVSEAERRTGGRSWPEDELLGFREWAAVRLLD